MGFRYRKTKSIAPGVKVNLNKNSASVRFGGKGAGVTYNTNGKVTRTAGIPGTGLSYTESSGGSTSTSNKSSCFGCLIPVIILVLVLSIGIAFVFSDCAKHEPQVSGMDVFTISNHPIYGDSFDEAKEFYKDYLDDNIVYFDGNYQKYESGTTLITLDGIGLNEKKTVNEIELYFKNTETGVADLDTALKIIKEYLPIEIMQKYYAFDCSYMLEKFDTDASNKYVRIVCYTITEVGSELRNRQIEEDNYQMPYSFVVTLYSKDDLSIIDSATIKDSLSKEYNESNYLQNKLVKEKWDYDFLSPDGVPIMTTEPPTESTTEQTTEIETTTKIQNIASAKTETIKQTEGQTEKQPAQQSNQQSGTYTLNTKTGKYHYSNCYTLKKANAENLMEIGFSETSNYSPCQKCNPPQA